MSDVDHLAIAREYLNDASQSPHANQRVEWTAAAQAHATVAVAQALTQLAARPYAVPGQLAETELDEPVPYRPTGRDGSGYL